MSWPFTGSGAELWQMLFDLAGPAFRRRLDAAARRSLFESSAAALDAYGAGGVIDTSRAWSVRWASRGRLDTRDRARIGRPFVR